MPADLAHWLTCRREHLVTVPTSLDVARALATNDRRRCFAAVVLGATTRSEVAHVSELPMRKAEPALTAMIEAGVISDQAGALSVANDVFVDIMRSEAPPAPPSQHDDQPADIAAVLDNAIVDGRLVAWPAKRSKRLLVLDWLVQGFEPGLHYKEKVVNRKLGQFTDDTATMRRYLVDEGFLDRADGSYWRSGGSTS